MELYYTITFFILGTILGSFLNVVIYRTPKHESIIFGRSHCTQCNHELSPLELIPILSFIMLSGKCKVCKSKISIRYPAIELLTGILFLISYMTFGLSIEFVIAMPLILLLIIITMIDIDTMEINDRFQIGLLIIAIFTMFYTKLPIIDHLLGFFIISVPFYIIAILTEGIGGGDIKLIAIGGLLLGYKATLVAFFIAIILGSILAIYLLIIKKSNRKTQLAFGPFLCIGIFIAYHFSDLIIQSYLQLWI